MARPKTPPSNSIISPYIASARPCIRTIPSDTDTTVPSFWACEDISRFSIRFLITSLISDGFSCCMCIVLQIRISSLRLILTIRSEEHTSELQSRQHLVCRLLLEKKKKHQKKYQIYK